MQTPKPNVPRITQSDARSPPEPTLYRSHFTAKALRLMKLPRAALTFLSLAIHAEERKREQARPKDGLVLPMPVDTWEVEWKT